MLARVVYTNHSFTSGSSAFNFWDYSYVLTILGTILIAAAGNLINDYFDQSIDLINKPKKVFILDFNTTEVWFWYSALNLLGIVLFGLVTSNDLIWLSIPVFSAILLFVYSRWLKKTPLIGNLIISIQSAAVFFVAYYASHHIENQFSSTSETSWSFTFWFGFYAFAICLVRELQKDILDIKGDEQYDCKTMPIIIGSKPVQWIIVLLLAAISCSVNFVPYFNSNNQSPATITLLVSVPAVLGAYATFVNLSVAQKLSKLTMLGALVFILINEYT